MKTTTKTTKQMPILKAQRIVRRYLRYGVVANCPKETPEVRAHAEKQLARIDKQLDSALRRIG